MPTYTNKWVNSELVGATVGVIGSGGAWPTGWSASASYSGVVVTWEIISLTTATLQYIMRVKLTVANTSGSDAYINLTMGDIASVTPSAVHQIYEWLRYYSGSSSGTTYFLWLASFEYTSGYSYLGNNTGHHNLTTTWTRGGAQFTTRATTGVVIPYIGVGVPTSNTYITEFDVSQPMFVPGSWLPSYIPTTSATPVSADVWPFRGHNRTYLEL